MTGKDILKEITQQQVVDQHFIIKWWRKENDFIDYELIDNFLGHLEPEHEFGGFELLDIEMMWQRLADASPTGVCRDHRASGEFILWRRDAGGGEMVVESYPYTPESLVSVFDMETRGDVLC